MDKLLCINLDAEHFSPFYVKKKKKKSPNGLVDGFPASTASISDFRITKPQKRFVC